MGDGSKDLITGDLVTKIAKAHGKASGATVSLKWLVQSGVPQVRVHERHAQIGL